MQTKRYNYTVIKNLAYAWDSGPMNLIKIKDRINYRYGPEYVKNKMDSTSGQIESALIEPRFQHLLNPRNQSHEKQHPMMEVMNMPVPESEYERWLHSIPVKDVEHYQQKKALLDKYLNSFTASDRNKLIRTLITNSDVSNYVSFMDLNPDLMTSQQYLVYKDIIKFYDLENYHNLRKDAKLWEQFQTYMNHFDQMRKQNLEVKPEQNKISDELLREIFGQEYYEDIKTKQATLDAKKVDSDDKPVEKISDEFLKSTSTVDQAPQVVSDRNIINEINEANLASSNSFEHIPELSPLLNMQTKLDQLSKQLENQRILTESIIKQQHQENSLKQNQVNHNFYQERIKPLVFNPQTTILDGTSIFGQNNEYAPRSIPNIINKGNLILSNPKIDTGRFVTTIAELIDQRDKIWVHNKELVNEIINKQIAYNNQYLAGMNVGNINIPSSPIPSVKVPLSQITDPFSSTVINELMINQPQQEVNKENVKVSLDQIKNASSTNKDNTNNLFNSNATINSNDESNVNKPISLSKLINRAKPVVKPTSPTSLSNLSVNQQILQSPINQMGQSSNISSIVNNQQVIKPELQNISATNKLNNKNPVQTIRPYKPNKANAIRKVNIPTKSFVTNSKPEFEPTNINKDKLINDKVVVAVNNQTTNNENQTVVQTEENSVKLSIPSKKIR